MGVLALCIGGMRAIACLSSVACWSKGGAVAGVGVDAT